MRRAMNVHANVVLDATASVRTILDAVNPEGCPRLPAPEGRQVCEAYDIAVPKEAIAKSADDAAAHAEAMGFPVVLKIVSPQILHKTEAGGVLVGLKSAAEGRAGHARIIANARGP